MTSPLALPSLAGQVQRAQDTAEAMGLRIGTVTGFSTGTITVSISGSPTLVNATYLFGQYWPRLGEEVLVARVGSAWVVLGALSAQSSNMVQNPSFEDSATGTAPTNWSNLVISGASPTTFNVDSIQDLPLEGPNQCHIAWTRVSGGGSLYTLSRPILVTPGQVWAISGWAAASSTGIDDTSTVNIGASFYAHASDGLGTTVASDAFAGGAFLNMNPEWTHLGQVSRGIIIPAGATAMRVFLWTTVSFGATASSAVDTYWDRIIAKRIS